MSKCEKCGSDVSEKVEAYSKDKFDGKIYCFECQKKVRGDTGWEYKPPIKDDADAKNKGTLDGYSGGEVPNHDSEEIDDIDAIAAENEEELNAALNDEFTALRDKIGVGAFEQLYEWITSEYGKDTFDVLSIEDKKAVLAEAGQGMQKREPEKKESSDGKEGEGAKVVDAEIVGDAVDISSEEEKEEEKWGKTAEIDEGTFMFREEEGKLLCRNGANNNEYVLDVSIPSCSCPDFLINKRKNKYCKHLKASVVAGYNVKELPVLPEEVTNALVMQEKDKPRRAKARKEEMMSLMIMDKQVELSVQVPTELILSEEKAVETIKAIVGPNPNREDVIMSYAGIEELNASLVTSLAQYIGIRHIPIEIEEEKQRMNIGKIYLATASREQKAKYEAVANLMGEVDITTRCRITTLSAWRDKSGSVRIGIGTKEEVLLPHQLADIARRGAAFLRTTVETKSAKKSILNSLPVSSEGLLRKIKKVYGWE